MNETWDRWRESIEHNLKRGISAYLRVKVTPGAKKNALRQIMVDGDGEKTIKVHVQAPAEKGKANQAVCTLMKKELKAEVEVISGHTGRVKLLQLKRSGKK